MVIIKIAYNLLPLFFVMILIIYCWLDAIWALWGNNGLLGAFCILKIIIYYKRSDIQSTNSLRPAATGKPHLLENHSLLIGGVKVGLIFCFLVVRTAGTPPVLLQRCHRHSCATTTLPQTLLLCYYSVDVVRQREGTTSIHHD